jgi:hypothetical protein
MLEPTSLIFLRIAMMNPKNNPLITIVGSLLFLIIAQH